MLMLIEIQHIFTERHKRSVYSTACHEWSRGSRILL